MLRLQQWMLLLSQTGMRTATRRFRWMCQDCSVLLRSCESRGHCYCNRLRRRSGTCGGSVVPLRRRS